MLRACRTFRGFYRLVFGLHLESYQRACNNTVRTLAPSEKTALVLSRKLSRKEFPSDSGPIRESEQRYRNDIGTESDLSCPILFRLYRPPFRYFRAENLANKRHSLAVVHCFVAYMHGFDTCRPIHGCQTNHVYNKALYNMFDRRRQLCTLTGCPARSSCVTYTQTRRIRWC
jgi:hypothetical protein